ncbi:MAG: WbqC family protein [Bacteroidales bacterium]|nr:WbqC family protein [Bacteroidales bacterium]
MLLLPCFYNATISYYSIIQNFKQDLVVEVFDHYTKQTYRNRCKIMGANGPLTLSIPVIKNHGSKIKMKDIRIDYSAHWHLNHWKSIVSSYASAPFFEFMTDTFNKFYKKKYAFLADLNLELITSTLDLLGWRRSIIVSERFERVPPDIDLRETMHPKKPFVHANCTFNPAEYHQVFMERHGFFPDLSILDLLFNEGPNAASILAKSLTKNS